MAERARRPDPWLLLPVAAYLAAFLLSRDRWTDPLVDYGRQLYVPWRILEGEVLYRDIAHVFGPLAAYLNAAVFAVLGVSMRSLVLFNLGLIAAFAVLLQLAFRDWFGRVAGIVAPLLFLLLFAFPQYVFQANYNFVTPYSHDLSYGLMLAVLALYCVLPRDGTGRVPCARLVAGGLAAGAVLMTKPELVFALACALGCACARIGGGSPISRAGLVALGAGICIPPVAAWLSFVRLMPPADAARAVLGALHPVVAGRMGDSPFYAWVSGFDAPARNGLLMVALAVPWVLAAWTGARLDTGGWRASGRAKLLALVLVAAASAAIVLAIGQAWIVDNAVRALPLLVAGVIWWLWRRRGCPVAAPFFRARLAVAVFALAMLAKMPFNAHLFHYGFVLALPATLLLAGALTARWELPPERSLVLRSLLGVLALAVVTAHVLASVAHFALRQTPLALGADTILVFDPARDPRTALAGAFVQWGQASLPADATVLVLPDAAMLNFALRRHAGVAHYALPRPELTHFGEDAVLQAYRRTPPDFIVMVDQRPGFFGRFGDPGYGERIARWVSQAYVPVARFSHDPGRDAGIVVLARGAAPAGTAGGRGR